jgi:voltage-gated sodium channel
VDKKTNRNQSRLFVPMSQDIEPYRIKPIARIIYGNQFELGVIALILLNAVTLAALTYDDLTAEVELVFQSIDSIIIWFFVAELAIRMASYGAKPWRFFKDGWNVFDFLIIALIPLLSNFTIVLRLLRLLRVIRIFRFIPEFKLLSVSFTKSLRPMVSLAILISFLIFIYAMAGFYLFGQVNPNDWGNLGIAYSTLVIMLTLENFPEVLEATLAVSPLAWLHLVSFMFVVVFTILNVLIGIVINAMDEARAERDAEASPEPSSKLIDRLEARVEDEPLGQTERERLRRLADG